MNLIGKPCGRLGGRWILASCCRLGPLFSGLLSVLALGLLAQSAAADACDARPSPCVIDSGTTTGAISRSTFGSDGDDDSDGDDANNYKIINDGQVLVIGDEDDPFGIALLSLGGEGSDDGRTDGGDGGDLRVDNNGSVRMQGDPDAGASVIGILVESLGGDGGGSLSDQGIGTDDGGKGGDGGTVTISNAGDIFLLTDTRNSAFGIYGFSKGGTGGDQNGGVGGQSGGAGGQASAVEITNSGSVALGTASSFAQGANSAWGIAAEAEGVKGGENGGKGGDGGPITIVNSGSVAVYWDETDETEDGVRGLYAKSRGGKGLDADDFDGGKGDSGFEVSVIHAGSVFVQSTKQPDGFSAGVFAVSEGAEGGGGGSGAKDAGDGGDASRKQGASGEIDGESSVVLQANGWVTTAGDGLFGVVAASLGGKGGDGDDGSQDSDGGDGGFGGDLSVRLEADAAITTNGLGAFGVVAQSLGGEGGKGGDNRALVGTSGGGGFGGDGGDVSFSGAAGVVVQTGKQSSTALLVQSIGGFGGTGGDFVSVLGGASGNGGNGGDGGEVSVENAANLFAFGDFSNGLVAQSIAGSGGAGAVDSARILSLGGDGGAGGRAGNVSVTNSGVIATFDDNAKGIIAQSISGGGGVAATFTRGKLTIGGSAGSAGTGNDVTVTHGGSVQTDGKGSTGILAQSIGGGGGSAGGTFGIGSVGGAGGDGGDGDSVTVLFADGVVATGDDGSSGVSAQSIGGGGGDGGLAFDFAVLSGVAVGGRGGTGGSGGAVYVGNLDQDDGAKLGEARINTAGEISYGILAQSIGGGGGSGGNAVGEAIFAIDNFLIGGRGGSSSDGGEVAIAFDDLLLITQSSNSAGIVAQSIGGGGGSGGAAYGADESLLFAFTASIGGDAGAGGQGAAARVHLTDSRIATDADPSNPDVANPDSSDSPGLVVQSIGGGGGIGGRSVALALAEVLPGLIPLSFSGTLSIGGGGGIGGDGSTASADLDGSTRITTAGAGSHAVLGQSIGGGGGHAGNSRSYPVALGIGGGVFEWAMSTSVGGQGGGGGDGDRVTILLQDQASIATQGDSADGILAQSVGGGGGNAGAANLSATAAFGIGIDFTTRIGVGGSGGSGGDGGEVDVLTEVGSSIETAGATAYGIVAQSIGGGGGTSQGNSLAAGAGVGAAIFEVAGSASLTVGNSGGGGGDGGRVTVTNRAKKDGVGLLTWGDGASGIVAQSIGGGGGIGGSVAADAEVQGSVRIFTSPTFLMGMGIGGTGGAGGDGGQVTVTHAGAIETRGDHADGILAQSIGGGGGLGGQAFTKSGVFRGFVEIEAAIGGTGGDGGDGGRVDVIFDDNNANLITTRGYMSHGVVLQSIGGGGGRGGDGTDDPNGIFVVGGIFAGGGGRADNGGRVNVGTDGQSFVNINSFGDDAMALVAQSIGGGGGLGGQGAAARSDAVLGATLNIGVGGGGGSGGDGGSVIVETGFNLATEGERAHGLVAQSIGGGGGIGGSGSDSKLAIGVTIGGSGGAAGDGGSVAIAPTAGSRIATQGAGAHGIVAQSIGGGGGIAGDATGAPWVLSFDRSRLAGSNDGDGGEVGIAFDGSIATSGADAFGILAQSIGNGGGFGGDSNGAFAGSTGDGGDGDGDAIRIVQSGSIRASGQRAIGIFAQSQGDDDGGSDPDSNGVIEIVINGAVEGGGDPDQGAGVLVAAGRDNRLTINQGGSVSAASGVAIRYLGDRTTDFGSTLTVINSGTVSGSILMANQDGTAAAGAAAPNSKAAATPSPIGKQAAAPSPGTFVNQGLAVGAKRYEARVINRGTLEVGEGNAFETVTIDGDFLQESDGVLAIDADFEGGRADKVMVTGDTDLKGSIALRVNKLAPGRRLQILKGDGKIEQAVTIKGSDLFRFDLAPSAEGLSLVADAAFTEPSLGLSERETRVAEHLQAVWNAGGNANNALFNELAAADGSGFANSLSAFEGEILLAPGAESIWLAQQRLDRSLSCPDYAATSLGGYLRQGDCTWAQVSGQIFDQGSIDGAKGYSDRVFTYALGGQAEVAPNLFLGLSAAYDDSRIRSDDKRVTIDGDIFSVAAAVKYDPGPWLAAVAVAGSIGDYDNSRSTSLGSLGGTATSSANVYSFNSRLRGAYTYTQDWFYARPFADLDIVYTRQDSIEEGGAGGLDLAIDAVSETTVLGTPALELGGLQRFDNGLVLRGFARGGVTFSSTGDISTTARLATAPAGADGFELVLPGDQVFGRVGAGLELARINLIGERTTVAARLQYDGVFSGSTTRNAGSLQIALGF